MRTYRKKILFLAIAAVIFGSFGYGAAIFAQAVKIPDWENLQWRLNIMYQNPNQFIRHFSPTWRSIKKITDIYYLPQIIFHTSTLPTYELTINHKDLQTLINTLPALTGGEPQLTDEYKNSIRGTFKKDGVESDARIRYRGLISNHWNARKKSVQITQLDDAGSETITHRLFLPEDRLWAVASLEAYRLEKFGVLTPRIEFITLKINGKDFGVYMEIEDWNPPFLERNNRIVGEIFSEMDIPEPRPDYFRYSSREKWEPRIDITNNQNREALERFLFVISETTDEEFAAQLPHILDMEKMYGWMLETLLSRNYHQQNTGNLNFYYDPLRDILEPIGFDMPMRPLEDSYDASRNRLVNRIWKHKPFRQELEKRARAYVNDPKNLEDDLAYYDKTVVSIEKDIMADTAKLPPTSLFFSETRQHRTEIISNVHKIQEWTIRGEIPILFATETYPLPE